MIFFENAPITLLIVIGLFALINITAFLFMLSDKIKSASSGAERISEGLMFFMAAAWGALGVYIGMFVFRHKTQKWYFLIGIPLLIIQNIAIVYLVYKLLSSGY